MTCATGRSATCSSSSPRRPPRSSVRELELVKAEWPRRASAPGGAGMFGGAGVAALIGRGALTDTIIAALDTAMALAGRP
jgi:hypothetical protein